MCVASKLSRKQERLWETVRAPRWSITRWPRLSKQAEFDIVYGKGISREGSIIDMGVEAGIVRKSGSWFTYGDDQLGQGKENVRQFLVDNPELANEIEQKILIALGIAEEPEPEKGSKKAPAVDPDEDAGF